TPGPVSNSIISSWCPATTSTVRRCWWWVVPSTPMVTTSAMRSPQLCRTWPRKACSCMAQSWRPCIEAELTCQ
ncbi:hypothetical protein FOZ61_003467, partial [Perkinsus olseni]